jgi:hypothetical protein
MRGERRLGFSPGAEQGEEQDMPANALSHFRASRQLVRVARYEALSRFQNLPWRQRAKAVRMLIEELEPLPAVMERAAQEGKPYGPK